MKSINVIKRPILKELHKKCFSGRIGPPVPPAPPSLDVNCLALPPPDDLPKKCDPLCYTQPKVVIIGAGMAGLSAAHRLIKCGIDNVTILEATERPGGRIVSTWMGDTVAELGPPWDQGKMPKKDNPLYSLGLRKEFARSVQTRGLFTRPFGDDMALPVVISAFQKVQEIERDFAELFPTTSSKSNGSLYDFIGMRMQQEIRKFPEDQQYDAARVMFGLINILHTKYGKDMTFVCKDYLSSFLKMPCGGTVRVPLGATAAIAPLLRDLPDGIMRFCKPVATVHWGTAQKKGCRALVVCKDGDEYLADYVLVTVSVGVLRRFNDVMFCPALPADKICALCRMCWGTCNKIYLDYCRPFWCWSTVDIRFRFSSEDLCRRKDWTRGVISIEPATESSHVLCVMVDGPDACSVEALSDTEIVEGVTELLREYTKIKSLPCPSCVLRSRWCSDPFFCGSYVQQCCDPLCEGQCVNELGSPEPGTGTSVPPVLLFAGEATAPLPYVGTVAGARLSGVREAERIAHLTSVLGGPPLPVDADLCAVTQEKTEDDKEEESEEEKVEEKKKVKA